MHGKYFCLNPIKKINFFFVFIRLYEVPKKGDKNNGINDNIFSWVHKEFKANDINASKHRLLCKLDDMSHGKKKENQIKNRNFFY